MAHHWGNLIHTCRNAKTVRPDISHGCLPQRILLMTLFSSFHQSRPRANASQDVVFLLVILLVLLIGLSRGLGDTVQITLAGLSDAASTLLLVVLEDTNLLEGLEDLAVNGARGIDVPGGSVASVLGGAVDLAEAADTNRLAEVDVAGDRGGADVEPVNVQRGQLLGGAGLDGVDPTRDGQLALTLQEASIGVDELLRIDIAHTDSASHDCGIEGVVGDGGVGLVVGLSKREGCRGRLSRIDFP
jgi:hypothetical protein